MSFYYRSRIIQELEDELHQRYEDPYHIHYLWTHFFRDQPLMIDELNNDQLFLLRTRIMRYPHLFSRYDQDLITLYQLQRELEDPYDNYISINHLWHQLKDHPRSLLPLTLYQWKTLFRLFGETFPDDLLEAEMIFQYLAKL